ncbi:hypothetical protein PCASD_26648 [Puccinia coronata f. sp. avenae]|uniref:Uncharacterized protein n=1 Tax=Puccinia coronata f. sp. avenae TaxID=200324 RepID=A0A2N5RXC5_9BASI|nr:hypothetical protein PCASD_26648 [Puccinia coronata f. sp. avenae]
MPGTQPSQLLTPLFSPNEGTMALTTGIIMMFKGMFNFLTTQRPMPFASTQAGPSHPPPSPRGQQPNSHRKFRLKPHHQICLCA